MNFDEIIDRRNTHSMKWDVMQQFYGVSPDNGLAMWVADMDFRPPPAVTAALQAELEHGVHGYFGNESSYNAAICQWMQQRHQWTVNPEWIKTVHGLVAGTALCIQAFTEVGDGIILFTPVYHAFARTIKANQRQVVESPLTIDSAGLYRMDLEALEQQLTGQEKMVILCSPHNPGGRVWTATELQALADFCLKHNLLLVSDEIHHDLVFAGYKHIPMPVAAPQIRDRLIMLTATTKTFNIAGGLTGNVIIENPELLKRFANTMMAAGSSPNRFGVLISTAAYLHGQEWLDELLTYLDGNRQVFDAGIQQIQGLESMRLEATYLAWVNFKNTGLNPQQVIDQVQKQAGIAASYGSTFGSGGESYLRFNLATPCSRIEQALERLQASFK